LNGANAEYRNKTDEVNMSPLGLFRGKRKLKGTAAHELKHREQYETMFRADAGDVIEAGGTVDDILEYIKSLVGNSPCIEHYRKVFEKKGPIKQGTSEYERVVALRNAHDNYAIISIDKKGGDSEKALEELKKQAEELKQSYKQAGLIRGLPTYVIGRVKLSKGAITNLIRNTKEYRTNLLEREANEAAEKFLALEPKGKHLLRKAVKTKIKEKLGL